MPKKYRTYVMNSFMYLNGKLPDEMNIEMSLVTEQICWIIITLCH